MRTLPNGRYELTLPGTKVTVEADVTIDECGYWFTHQDNLVLHVAHGHLLTISPEAGPVPSKAEDARTRLRAQAGR